MSYWSEIFCKLRDGILNSRHIANLPDDAISPLSTAAKTGVYYGFAQITLTLEERKHTFSEEDTAVLPMVMSLGYNPFYGNKQLSAVSTVPEIIT
jgi:hypothetical protein